MFKKQISFDQLLKHNKFVTLTNNAHYFFFILLFFIQLNIFQDFGFPNDEEISRNNGLIAYNYVLDIFNLHFLTPYSGLPEFESYYDKDYGVIFELLLVIIEKIFSLSSYKEIYLTRHFFISLFFFIGSIYFYLTLRKFFSKEVSLLGTVIFVIHPRIFAQSFYNSKDIIFLVFFCISNYYFINFFIKQNIRNIFFLSLFIAITISIRPMGILLPILFIFFFTLTNLDRYKLKNFSLIIVFVFLTFFFTFLFWPYLWDNPANLINSLKSMSKFRFLGEVFFNGEYYIAKYMPWYYIPVNVLITTPLFVIVLFLIGSIVISKKLLLKLISLENDKENIWSNNLELFLFYSLMIIFLTIILIIELNATVYTGWRQVYYIYPSIIFISVFGIKVLIEKINFKKFINFLLIVFICFNLTWIIKNHPYQYTYFNTLIHKNILRNFELDYYGVSNLDTLKKLIKINNQNVSKIYVFSVTPYHLSLNLLNDSERKKILFTNNKNDADYLVTNHFYQKHYFNDKNLFKKIHPIDIEEFLKDNYELVNDIKANGVSINSIYKIK